MPGQARQAGRSLVGPSTPIACPVGHDPDDSWRGLSRSSLENLLLHLCPGCPRAQAQPDQNSLASPALSVLPEAAVGSWWQKGLLEHMHPEDLELGTQAGERRGASPRPGRKAAVP